MIFWDGWKKKKNRHPGLFVCGFSMETENMVEKLAREAGEEASRHDRGEQSEDGGRRLRCGDGNVVTLITKDGIKELPLMGKDESGWLPAGRDCGTAVILSESGIFFRFLVDAGKMNAL